MKIVSLVPSITELLVDLALEDQLKGVTRFCIHPTSLQRDKVIVGGTKNVHMDRIQAIQPDLVIANKEENVKEQVEAIAREFPVYSTDVNSFDEALSMILETGRLTDRASAARLICDTIERNFNQLETATQGRTRKTVAYLIWKNPFMAAAGGTFIDAMLRLAGFDNVLANQSRYPVIGEEVLTAGEVDTIFLSSEPFPFKQKHIDELHGLSPGKEILLVDGEMFSWYGSRMLYAADYFKSLHKGR